MTAPAGGLSLRAVPKPGSVVLYAGPTEIYTLDGEGRLFSAFVGGTTFRRSFGNDVVEKRPRPERAGGPAGAPPAPWQRHRRPLPPGEARDLLGSVYEGLRHAPLPAGPVPGSPLWPGGPALQAWWQKARAWTPERLAADGDRFRATYGRIGILPPDQYMAVVAQATVGCSYNRCTFCDLYRGQTFAIRPPEAFRRHLDGVRTFFGDALAGRRWLFLGEGNALALPVDALAPALAALAEAFPVAAASVPDGPALRAWFAEHPAGFGGVAGFLDVPGGRRRPAAEWAALRALGLRRAFIGLETGHAPLRRFVRKPGSSADILRTLAALRDGGVGIAVIVMLGLGGRRFAAGHVQDTLQLLARAALGPRDLIYLSPFVERPGSAYAGLAAAAGVAPCDPAEVAAQHAAFVRALRRPGGPHLALYDIGEYLY